MSTVLELLAEISKEQSARSEKKLVLEKKFEAYGKEIVIYGHGNLGCELCKGLENANWTVQYFLDANQPTDLNRKNVNLKDAAKYLTPDALIIVAIYNVYLEYSSIQRQLQSMGFQNILSVLDLRVWPELFQTGHIHGTLSWDISHIPAEPVCEAYSLMEDSLSQKTFLELLRFFISDNEPTLTLCPAEMQYMPALTYLPIAEERIIDCGAYNGDTMRAFYSETANWSSYIAIEPDPQNMEKLAASIQADLPEALAKRTKTICAAVSDVSGSITFCTKGNAASHITEEAVDQISRVPVISLDEVIQEPVSLIKMDIEGFELRALQGAERLIRANQPLLAICGYHRQSDLWEIPLYMKKVLPNHRIYLRNYIGIIEYVFYAVPENRVISEKQ
ncbi:MAG: FkbM family methyltransferase [Oscillibacter sp.]|nr:FkbM family methyltransferase [Oscillibacter sp.]